MIKQNIQQSITDNIKSFINAAEKKNEELFFQNFNNKWSVAENSVHLILSVKPINMVLSLPRFTLCLFGKLNRATMNYDDVVKKYLEALLQGAVAKNDYIPKKKKLSKVVVLQELKEYYDILCIKIEKWDESDLDKYLLPHPIIGKITVREMLYFTIYHIEHHTKAITKKL